MTFQERSFRVIHGRNLIYNTCWEDPRIDRQALEIGPEDTVMVITSAGCNALDYLLAGAKHVYAVDMNPHQNALLELKIAAIKRLDHELFFEMFGKGRTYHYQEIYRKKLRPEISQEARQFWDRHIKFFSGQGWRESFYYRGTVGFFARILNAYIDRRGEIRDWLQQLMKCSSLEEQSNIYTQHLRPLFWSKMLRWTMDRNLTLALLGVPKAQRLQLEKQYLGGIVQFIEDRVDRVFGEMPIYDNYFYQVYLRGDYAPDCCPEYLRAENFDKLRERVDSQISVHSASVQEFLENQSRQISRFVLLDHMDWMSNGATQALRSEWQAIVNRAAPGAKLIWRSAGLEVNYVDPIEVRKGGRKVRLGELLSYEEEKARRLHSLDRVQTYGSFYIANLAAA